MSIHFVEDAIVAPQPHTATLRKFRLDREAQALVEKIVGMIKDQFEIEPEITVFNKKCNQPRDIQFRSDVSKGYFYSGQVAKAKPMTPDLATLLAMVNQTTGAQYNAILINRYKNGSKNVGAHSDSKEALDDAAGVFAISYGATRNFRIRDSKTKAIVRNVPAKHGEALQMAGNFQDIYTHEIPKELTVHGERISFTFRKHDPAAEVGKWAAHERKQAAAAAEEARRNAAKQALKEQLTQKRERQAADEEQQAIIRATEKRKRDDDDRDREAAKQAADEEAAAKKAKIAAAEAEKAAVVFSPGEEREVRRRIEAVMTAPMPVDALPAGTTKAQWMAMNEETIREMVVEERGM
jgi:alkylated DNA repair dioxygenase AlkB